uniref:F-box domain-containing protein n=1 Tax=Cannabis sativa TaxID=3483 RepID=A0A803R6V1_CANSA
MCVREIESLLCDELIVEIFQKLPLSSCSSVSLVSKRWLHLYRTSKPTLFLELTLFCYFVIIVLRLFYCYFLSFLYHFFSKYYCTALFLIVIVK